MSDWPTRRLVNVMDQPSTAATDLDALIARLREILGLAESAPGWEWPVGAILLEKTVAALAALRADAERWRWWKHDHIHVARDEPGDWTCWMEMDQIPFRSETTSVDDLTDALIMRFPIDADRAAKP